MRWQGVSSVGIVWNCIPIWYWYDIIHLVWYDINWYRKHCSRLKSAPLCLLAQTFYHCPEQWPLGFKVRGLSRQEGIIIEKWVIALMEMKEPKKICPYLGCKWAKPSTKLLELSLVYNVSQAPLKFNPNLSCSGSSYTSSEKSSY